MAEPDWLPPSEDEAEVTVEGRVLRLSSLGRVLYPAVGFTKRQLIAYYAAVADVLLPHIAGRPLTLGRWPTGVDERGFAQMECRGAPEWMKTRPLVLRTGEVRHYCVIDDLPSLVWAANQSTIELHPYYASAPDERDAPFAIFDLDPRPGSGLLEAAAAALRLRELLAERGREAVVKSSGGDGVHVFVPLDGPCEFARVRAFCDELAAALAAPQINVDCAQNHPRRSLAAPYSLRAADAPVVSAPLRWAEIEHAVADASRERLVIGAAEMPARIAELGDLFEPLLG